MPWIALDSLLDPDILERFGDPAATQLTKLLLLGAQQLRNQRRILAAVEAAALVPQFSSEPKAKTKPKKEK